jgi:ketosteroid isomerase-like protein
MASDALLSELVKRVEEFWSAFQGGDRAGCLGIYADDATFFRSDEGFDPYFKNELAANFDEWVKRLKIHAFHILEPRAVRLSCDAAILIYRQNFKRDQDQAAGDTNGFVTCVFVNQLGTWRIAHVHESCHAPK